MFSETKQLEICGNTAVQIFIAADALDVAAVRDDAETYLGQFMLQGCIILHFYYNNNVSLRFVASPHMH